MNKPLPFLLPVILLLGAVGTMVMLNSIQKDTAKLEASLATIAEEIRPATLSQQIEGDAYQAVFLGGKEVYFGKLRDLNTEYFELTDIFYLRDQASLSSSSRDLSLVKLGNELHGPEDKMLIRKDRVQFVENLKDNGQVVKAINSYKQSQ